MAAYKRQLVEYAGGRNPDEAALKAALGDAMTVDLSTDRAAFVAAMGGVDAVVDETYASNVPAYDFDAFLAGFGLTAETDVPFIRNRKVFRVDADISGTSNLDWYESRLVNPVHAVEGLQRVLAPDASKPKKLRNIALGEEAVAVSEDSCTKGMLACGTSELPAALAMINDIGQTEGQEDPVSSAPQHLVSATSALVLLLVSLF
eukprot:CAMPEP_0179275100 /NCGR_PEP_ID=MMETSP0797-20121207/33886_1 /TAXON_ID=47934 /ORGANISM="Dinophysis acuminata, Strain DAEP01" /LENGTH=203 /DNA_ID=CAMNT_0020983611 /DNA_START=23 /DNA_END=634 /DNA_ORIENTATION=+